MRLEGGLQGMIGSTSLFNANVDNLAISFSSPMVQAIDHIFPSKLVKRHHIDKPWITPTMKSLIRDRQKAFHNGNTSLCQSLRRKVHQEIERRRKSLYENNVQHLKTTDCCKWWKMVNKMSGKPEKTASFSLEHDGEILNNDQLATALNEFYVSVNADILALDVNLLTAYLPSNDDVLSVQPQDVCRKLQALQSHKATGPDNVPSRILKQFPCYSRSSYYHF